MRAMVWIHKSLWSSPFLSSLPPSPCPPSLLTLDAAAQERVMLRTARKEKARMAGWVGGGWKSRSLVWIAKSWG